MEKKAVPDISVVMPVYNSGQFLGESIESILNQTFDNFELIIVYDKSTDNSRETINKYMKIDDRIILIENENKLGVAAARNRGLEIARGRYIAVMDSDDISLPTRLEKEYLFLESNKDYFLIGGSKTDRIDEKGNYLETIKLEEDITSVIANRCPVIHSSVMFRNINIRYQEKFLLSEDYDFYLRVVSRGLKIKNIDEYLVKLRMTSSGLTSTNMGRINLFDQAAQKFYNQRLETGTDEYNKFDEKEILAMPNHDSRNLYLKYLITHSLKNGNIGEAKKYFEEYQNKISFKNRFIYKLALAFPILYYIRFKIKSFLKRGM